MALVGLSQISQAISCSFNALLEESLYTVRSGENTFVLTPDRGAGAKAGFWEMWDEQCVGETVFCVHEPQHVDEDSSFIYNI